MYKINPDIIYQKEFDGTGIVFNPVSNKMLMLNETGVAIWEIIMNSGTDDDAIARVLEKFPEVSPRQADADVHKFIVTLLEKSLITEG